MVCAQDNVFVFEKGHLTANELNFGYLHLIEYLILCFSFSFAFVSPLTQRLKNLVKTPENGEKYK